jgi:hypothetical protein
MVIFLTSKEVLTRKYYTTSVLIWCIIHQKNTRRRRMFEKTEWALFLRISYMKTVWFGLLCRICRILSKQIFFFVTEGYFLSANVPLLFIQISKSHYTTVHVNRFIDNVSFYLCESNTDWAYLLCVFCENAEQKRDTFRSNRLPPARSKNDARVCISNCLLSLDIVALRVQKEKTSFYLVQWSYEERFDSPLQNLIFEKPDKIT